MKTSCAWSARAAKAALISPIARAPSQNTNRGFQMREEVIRALERRNTLFRGARGISLVILFFCLASGRRGPRPPPAAGGLDGTTGGQPGRALPTER